VVRIHRCGLGDSVNAVIPAPEPESRNLTAWLDSGSGAGMTVNCVGEVDILSTVPHRWIYSGTANALAEAVKFDGRSRERISALF
jgi:hypothetical protein